jgi:hypothetical protein
MIYTYAGAIRNLLEAPRFSFVLIMFYDVRRRRELQRMRETVMLLPESYRIPAGEDRPYFFIL